jgi:hypothetical protein
MTERYRRNVRAPIAAHDEQSVEGCHTLWELVREGSPTIRADIVALIEGAEAEFYVGGLLRRRVRFLLSTQAARYAGQVASRLSARGYDVIMLPAGTRRPQPE